MIYFPANPRDGQPFGAPNGVLYVWQEVPGLWLAVSGTAALPVTSKTADYEVLSADDGARFDNRGATGPVAFTLTAEVCQQLSFVKEWDQPVVVAAPPGATIAYGEQVSSPGGTLTAGGVGSAAVLTGREEDMWFAEAYNGSWIAA